MPNSFVQLYIHHVSVVKFRQAMITPEIENQIYSYIAHLIKDKNQNLIAINGMPDHIHVLAKLKSDMMPAKFVQHIKGNTARYINQQYLTHTKFEWQRGGGTFSVSPFHVEVVKRYIWKQKEHHKAVTLESEYVKLLQENKLDIQKEYLPEFGFLQH